MSDLQSTALTQWHKEQGAKMVAFAGYNMPVQYSLGVMKEHLHTRDKAGLFDVSHMGQIVIKGDVAAILETVFPADLVNLPVNKQCYSLLLNEQGGVVDDLMICRRLDDWLIVFNASRKKLDIDFLNRRIGDQLRIEELVGQSLLALQGPKAAEVLTDLGADINGLTFMGGAWVSFQGIDCWLTRSGYTGEDGFEISVSDQDAEKLAQLLVGHADVEPIGLGARDSLRLEAGLCLYGHELTEETTPTDASLNWAIAKSRRAGSEREGGFVASDIVLGQMRQGSDRKRIGLVVDGRVPVRADSVLYDERGHEVGVVTSGSFSPTLQKPIAMAQIKAQFSDLNSFIAKIRNKDILLKKTSMPFVKPNYFRG